MKYHFSIFSFMVLFLFSSCKDELLVSPNEQEIITKSGRGEMIATTSLQTKIINKIAYTDYEIKDVVAGTYYLSAWVEIPLIDGKLPEYCIKINDELSSYTFKPTEPGFQGLILTDSNNEPVLVNLTGGNNKITLISVGREILNIEKLKVSASLKDAVKEESEYLKFINESKNGNSFAKNVQTFSVVPETSSDQIYDYALNVPASYTYKEIMYMEEMRVRITTSEATTPHVIELYGGYVGCDPEDFSFAAYGTTSATLDVMLPDWWGFYTLRIRSLNPGDEGILNFHYWENWQGEVNTRDYVNIPVKGTVIPMNRSLSSNYFLAKSTVGPLFNTMTLHAENPGKVVASAGTTRVYTDPNNDNIYYIHDAYKDYNKNVANLVVTTGMAAPNTIVDVYMGLPFASSAIFNAFPNLPKNNTFRSGNSTTAYNCISWTIERTDYWEWPGNVGSSYYDSNLLTAFDKLYAAYGYTRTGANESNAGIALWATSRKVNSITHASVTKNSHTRLPHGFDWESKCGSMERVMHERDGLHGSAYGSIYYYYKPIGFRSAAKTIADTEITDVTQIRSQASSLKQSIPVTKSATFENKYTAWKNTWKNPKISIHSNPRKYTESKEYAELLQLCQEYAEESWPLFIEKLAEGDILAINLVEDLTFEENASLMEKVKKRAVATKSGSIVLPSMYNNYINYCTELLNSKKFNK